MSVSTLNRNVICSDDNVASEHKHYKTRNMLQKYKQSTSWFSVFDISSPSRTVRLSTRRILSILCFIPIVAILFYILQTSLFLIGHFTQNDQVSNMIELDRSAWQQDNIDHSGIEQKIPRYIHQIWISSIKDDPVLDRFQSAANSCITLHSNYKYTLWTHKKILTWLTTHYPWFLSVYNSYRYDMQRIDAMKYLLLFHYGGLYVDLDVVCKTPDLITAMVSSFKSRTKEPDIIFHMGAEGISANTDIIAAKQHHPFFKLAVNQLKLANRWFFLYHLTIILSAGPTFLSGVYRQYPFKEDFYFIPNDQLWGRLIEGVGGGTWYGKDTFYLIYIMENKLVSFFMLLCLLSCCFLAVIQFLKRMRR